jgi:putative hydrolase of the HAD superfamily
MDIKLCICDVGGVVITNYQTLGRIAAKYGIELDELAEDYRFYDIPLMDGSVSTREYAEHLHARFGIPGGLDPMVEQFKPRPIPSGVEMVETLKRNGVRVVCGSNTCGGHWELMEKVAHLDELFDYAYLSYRMRVSKPFPQFYRRILEREGVMPEQALFIDDTQANVDAAAKQGLHGELFQNTFLWTAKDRILYRYGCEEF